MKHLIKRQMEGLPLCEYSTTKIEFQLRAKGSGRVVLSYDNEQKAKNEALTRNLHCYRITTVSDRLV